MTCVCQHSLDQHAEDAWGRKVCIAMVPANSYQREQTRPGGGVFADRAGGYQAHGRIGLLSRGELCRCEAYTPAPGCPHGEADWHGCHECLEDERGTRAWERDRDEGWA